MTAHANSVASEVQALLLETRPEAKNLDLTKAAHWRRLPEQLPTICNWRHL
jgi:hypothetical protein